MGFYTDRYKGMAMTIGKIPPKSWTEEEKIIGCSNDKCANSTKNIGQSFCPICGNKTEECFIDVRKEEQISLWDIMEKLDVWDIVFNPEFIEDEVNTGPNELWLSNRDVKNVKEFKEEKETAILLSYLDEHDIKYKIKKVDLEYSS